mgnify:CR=1 FL=1
MNEYKLATTTIKNYRSGDKKIVCDIENTCIPNVVKYLAGMCGVISNTYLTNIFKEVYIKNNDDIKIYFLFEQTYPDISPEPHFNFMNKIVMMLIYKKGCNSFDNDMVGNNTKSLSLTMRCVNTNIYGGVNGFYKSVSIFYDFGYYFFIKAKENGYTHIIQESAATTEHYTSDERKNKTYDYKTTDPIKYGKDTPIHLICNNMGMGFIENPDIALNYDCFDKGYPYNSMVIDLTKYTYKTIDEYKKHKQPSANFCNKDFMDNYKKYMNDNNGKNEYNNYFDLHEKSGDLDRWNNDIHIEKQEPILYRQSSAQLAQLAPSAKRQKTSMGIGGNVSKCKYKICAKCSKPKK